MIIKKPSRNCASRKGFLSVKMTICMDIIEKCNHWLVNLNFDTLMPDLTISIFFGRNGVKQKRLPDISNKLKWIFAWGLPPKGVKP